jgi:hypothetical protein
MRAKLYASSIPIVGDHLHGLTLSDFVGFDYDIDFGYIISLGEFLHERGRIDCGLLEITLEKEVLSIIKNIPLEVNLPFKLSFDDKTIWFCAVVDGLILRPMEVTSKILFRKPWAIDNVTMKVEVTSEEVLYSGEPPEIETTLLEDWG